MGHQWTHLNTKSFLARTFLDMYFYTITLYMQYKNNFSHVGDHDNDDANNITINLNEYSFALSLE